MARSLRIKFGKRRSLRTVLFEPLITIEIEGDQPASAHFNHFSKLIYIAPSPGQRIDIHPPKAKDFRGHDQECLIVVDGLLSGTARVTQNGVSVELHGRSECDLELDRDAEWKMLRQELITSVAEVNPASLIASLVLWRQKVEEG